MATAGCRTRQDPARGRGLGLGPVRGMLMQGRAVLHRAGDRGRHKDPGPAAVRMDPAPAAVHMELGHRQALGSAYRSAPWPACSGRRPHPAPFAVQQRSPAVYEPRVWELEACGKTKLKPDMGETRKRGGGGGDDENRQYVLLHSLVAGEQALDLVTRGLIGRHVGIGSQ